MPYLWAFITRRARLEQPRGMSKYCYPLPSPPHSTSRPSMKSNVLKFLSAGRSGRKQVEELLASVKKASTCLPGSLVRPPDMTSTVPSSSLNTFTTSFFFLQASDRWGRTKRQVSFK